MSVRRLKAELDNINASIATAARELAVKYPTMTEEQRIAFLDRIKTLGERANAISISISILEPA